MRCFLGILLVGTLTISSATSSYAQTSKTDATLDIVADGTRYVVPVTSGIKQGTDFKTWMIGGENGFQVQTPEYSISVSGAADYDPSILYGISVTDFGAPSAFGFFFASPIVPTGTPNTVRSSLSGALTDATGNGVSITPTLPDVDGDSLFELQTSDLTAPVTNMGIDVGAGFTSGPGPSGALFVLGPFSVGPVAGPGPGPWTGLQATLGFTLSGGNDVASINGFVEILPIPEPSSLALAAIVAAAALVRRRVA